MNSLDWLVLTAASLTFIGCFGRLVALQFKLHRPWIIILHMAMAACCAGTAQHALSGNVGILEVAAVLAAIAWLVVTHATWKHGAVPPQFHSGPVPLDRSDLTNIIGRGK